MTCQRDVRNVILIFFECNAIYVKEIEDRSNTPKGCNAMYVKDVKDGKRTYIHIFAHNFLNIQPIFNQILCILKHVEDVEDISNTHKGCNAMYVEDVEDGKRTYIHILLNTIFEVFDIHTIT